MPKPLYNESGERIGTFFTKREREREANDSILDHKLANVIEFFFWWFFVGWLDIECFPLDNEAVMADYIGFAFVIFMSTLFSGAFFIFLICWYLAKWAGVPLISDGMNATTIEWVYSVAFLILSVIASRWVRRYL